MLIKYYGLSIEEIRNKTVEQINTLIEVANWMEKEPQQKTSPEEVIRQLKYDRTIKIKTKDGRII